MIWADKVLDVEPKTIKQVESIEQLRNNDDENTDGAQSMFVLTILEKIKKKRLKLSQESLTVL